MRDGQTSHIFTFYNSFVNEQVVDFIKSIDRLLQNCDLLVSFHINSRAMDKKSAILMQALLKFLANKISRYPIHHIIMDGGKNRI